MSHRSVKAAFDKQIVLLPIGIIVPQKDVTPSSRQADFYRQLTASLKHIGLIEPLVVFPRGPGDYLLLEGHVRLEILKSLGATEVKCLLSTDDEAYTYNRHVNHIPAIAQHFMLLEALKNGLTEGRIASALDVSLDTIRARRDLLNGICPEVVQILLEKPVSTQVFAVLRKMKPIRQIEAAEHMVAGGTYTIPSGSDRKRPGFLFRCLLLFFKCVAEDTINRSLGVGGCLNDKAVVLFQFGNPVLNVSGRVAVGMFVGNSCDSTEEGCAHLCD
jgi:hypothetical protein